MKSYYHARAPEYDDWWLARGSYAAKRPVGWDDERSELLERWIADLPPARTLDVACGTGFLTQHLRGDVVGLDQSQAMIEVARDRMPDTRLVQGDALALPFPDGSFDRVFTSYFYCHLEEAERGQFLTEARRVAPELVIVGSRLQPGEQPRRWDERVLRDGSRWRVFKRVFVPEDLARELGGRVLHESRYFVMVVSP
ncbi:MAG TPA: class I SAM-dependent methyltransferase [Gaiellaceae bacterium]|nr:class I SAM-dependent methyltransferase [Gaiellaceae bacterium]